MSGKWLRREPGQEPPRFSRVALELYDGVVLHYDDLRLFGKLRVVKDAAFAAQPVIAALGPGSADRRDRRRPAGGAPGPQQDSRSSRCCWTSGWCPGIGNIQASESLFRAAIDPRRRANTLCRAEVGRLARAMRASIDYTLRSFERDVRGRDIQYVEDPGRPQPVQGLRPRGRALPAVQAGRRSPASCRRGDRRSSATAVRNSGRWQRSRARGRSGSSVHRRTGTRPFPVCVDDYSVFPVKTYLVHPGRP